MIVLKFGGTSVANAENLKKVRDILTEKQENFICVVSALSGVTNQLQELASTALNEFPESQIDELYRQHFNLSKELVIDSNSQIILIEKLDNYFQEIKNLCKGVLTLSELSERTLAKFLSYGEICSSTIIHAFLNQNQNVGLFPTKELFIGDGLYLDCDLDFTQTEKNIQNFINKDTNYLAPGFIASNNQSETILLGRGGSDYTSTIIGAAINADRVEIWSDVDGMLNANPKIVKQAKTIKQLSYDEALELSHFGAKVLHSKAVRPIKEKEIPVHLKNTFNPSDSGTIISNNLKDDMDSWIKGISSLSGISLINFSETYRFGNKKLLARLFTALNNIPFVIITQSSSERDISIGIKTEYLQQAEHKIKSEFDAEFTKYNINPITVESNLSIVALIGDNMKHKHGLSGYALSALGENGVNVVAIAQGQTERNISIVIDEKYNKKAINVLHEKFFFNTVTKKIHLFVAGMGNVGMEFLKILKEQREILIKKHHIELKLIGLINSSNYLIDEEGINLSDLEELRNKMITPQNLEEFQQKAINLNLRNSIFIDNTASKKVSGIYEGFLQNSIAVTTCNKIASSDNFSRYETLLSTAKSKNVQFRYETCVGAALPIIKTIQHLVLSGDDVIKIQAVLSGSLNYIFNNYNTEKPFADVVQDAKDEGYTEPNPLIDLSGVDVMRKILILVRESGLKMEMEDIENFNFLPEACLNATEDDLFSELEKHEDHFKKLYLKANDKGCRLKVVATYENGKAFVSLEEIPPESPIFHLEGKDNIVSINTRRYPEEPMVIKGAGAGASVTASGVFSDVMLMINQ